MKVLINQTLIVLCVLLLTTGCAKEQLHDEIVQDGVAEIVTPEGVDATKLSTDAKMYYELLKASIFATDSHVDQSEEENNPFVAQLKALDIVTEEGQTISFYDLDEIQQSDFLNDWALVEAEAMSKKIEVVDDLQADLADHNEAVRLALAEECMTRNGEQKVKDKKAFFAKVDQHLQDKRAEREETRLSVGGGEIPVAASKVKSLLQSHARRGDIMLRLPKHESMFSYASISNGEFSVGHSAIVTSTVKTSDSGSKQFAIGAQTHGVVDENINYWSYKSYILGIQKVTWRIKWNWFKTTTYKEITPVSNPGALADWGVKYKGRPYCLNWYEFAFSKLYAPSKFICTTLVWYSAKQAYGIDVSEWYTPLVSPSGLLRSENIYIRATIQ